MAIIFRNDGPWGTGQGSRLTSLQVDGNFYDHEQRIGTLENPDSDDFIGIADITIEGNSFIITLTDGSERGPFQIPTPGLRFRNDVNSGEWAPLTLYSVNDLFTETGVLYLVLYEHTSAATFDPGANNGGGQDYYRALLREPFRGIAGKTVSDVSYTLVSSDMATPYIRLTNAAGCLVQVPSGDDDNFLLWDEINIHSATSGNVIIDWDSDTTVNVADGFLPQLRGQHSTVCLKKVGTAEWDLMGLLVQSEDSF